MTNRDILKSVEQVAAWTQLSAIKQHIYATKTTTNGAQDQYDYTIADIQGDVLYQGAHSLQVSDEQVFYLKKQANVHQVWLNDVPITTQQFSVTHYLVSGQWLVYVVAQEVVLKADSDELRTYQDHQIHVEAGGLLNEKGEYAIYAYHLQEKTTRLITTSVTPIQLLDVHHSGQLIYKVSSERTGFSEANTLRGYDLAQQQAIDLPPIFKHYDSARLNETGEYLALTGHDNQYDGATSAHLVIIAWATQETVARFDQDEDVRREINSDVTSVADHDALQWHNGHLYFQTTYHGYSRIYSWFNQTFTQVYEDKTATIRSFLVVDKHIILSLTRINQAYEIIKVALADVTHTQTITASERVPLTIERFTVANGVHAWLLPTETMQKSPTLVYLHGGPHAAYHEAYFWEFHVWQQLGYNVVFLNPRGSTGYGQAFTNHIRGHYGESDVDDVNVVLTSLITQYQVNAQRLFVAGGSYGGFLSSWLIGHQHQFKAAAVQRAVTNWVSLYGTSDIGVSFVASELGFDLVGDGIEQLWDRSPIAYAKNVQTPVLLMHGEYDVRVPISQSEEYYHALKRAGATTKLIRFPKAWHGVSRSGKPSQKQARIQVMAEWFAQFDKGEEDES